MNRPSHNIRLYEEAYKLAEEIWDKKWEHIPDLKTKPAPDCKEIIDELQRRSPNCSVGEYKKAIAKGLQDSI